LEIARKYNADLAAFLHKVQAVRRAEDYITTPTAE